MAQQELYPWKCSSCHRINKKVATTCALCEAHWTSGVRHSTEPKQTSNQEAYSEYQDAYHSHWPAGGYYDWEAWEREDRSWNWRQPYTDRSQSPRSTQGSSTPRGKRGKGKTKSKQKAKDKTKDSGKGKTGEVSASPFAPLAPAMPPWPALDSQTSNVLTMPSNSPGISVEALAQKKECVAALKAAYPEGNAPAETKELIEKMDKDIERLEKDNNKMVTKSLHSATTSLSKAQKLLTETLDARKVHRARWTKHVMEAVTTWQNQLHEYRKQQAGFQEVVAKARGDIETARSAIQALSAKASQATLAAMPPNAAVTGENEESLLDADAEEEKAQGQLQTVLQSCAAALGVELQRPDNAPEFQDLTMDESEQVAKKRQRSLEPFGGPSPAGGAHSTVSS